VQIWFLWRPNLPDQGDNHIAELAIAGNAAVLVTFNVKDFLPAKFAAAGMELLTPAQYIQHYLL
jgi:predicted nucleic acid-binding protein